jgi:site-specific DNA recombinase
MKKRVVAYARVSSKSRSQSHSLDFQKSYWNERLATDHDYEYLGLYADFGISGKTMRNRTQFLQMLSKARDGGFDIIFTKSVQRFGRNTEELLSVVRELRDLGIAVVFEKENINTLEITSDLFLTVAAAVAQEDLSRYRANVVWSIDESYKRGEPISFGGRVYGYFVGKKCALTINEEEAEVVREMFGLCLKGYGLSGIKDHLNSKGIKSPSGGRWCNSTISGMLRNEKYKGDVMLHKEYQVNGVRKSNKGNDVDKYYIEDHHEPIVSKELWDKVQQALEAKSNPKLVGLISKEYPFTGLIECSCCHKKLHHKFNHSGDNYSAPWYRCSSTRDKCTSTAIREDILEELFIEAFNEFVRNKYKGVEEQDYQNRIDSLETEEKELTKLYANGWVGKDDYESELKGLVDKKNQFAKEQSSIRSRAITNGDFKEISVFDPSKVQKFIKGCIVKHDTLEFHFYNGVIISKKVVNRRIYHYVGN